MGTETSRLELVEKLTNHAKTHKIASLKAGDIEIVLHPSAFISHYNHVPEEPETDEEKLKREKAEMDEVLFHSAT